MRCWTWVQEGGGEDLRKGVGDHGLVDVGVDPADRHRERDRLFRFSILGFRIFESRVSILNFRFEFRVSVLGFRF